MASACAQASSLEVNDSNLKATCEAMGAGVKLLLMTPEDQRKQTYESVESMFIEIRNSGSENDALVRSAAMVMGASTGLMNTMFPGKSRMPLNEPSKAYEMTKDDCLANEQEYEAKLNALAQKL